MRTPIEKLIARLELEIGWIEFWQQTSPDSYGGVAKRLKEALEEFKRSA